TNKRGWEKGEERYSKHSGSSIHDICYRLQSAQLRAHQLQRVLLRHVETLERSQEQGGTVSGNKNSTEPGTQPFAAGGCFRLLAACGTRRRHLRWISVRPGRPRR